ncbi:ATP-binding protein [Saccharothrix xinjiangensis]|uniref:ATP-binding protein n=1 Tax=Saccharothrix xinjiangensis TaxID=204798 RepID=A0ABV9Y6V4_9PSEU
MEFSVLGPVRAAVGGRDVDLGPRRQQVVLAALLVDLGRPLPPAELVERVWGDRPPHRASATLRTYLSRLRAALPVDIERTPAGYLARVRETAVDLHRFRALLAAGQPDQALALWRGEPFEGLDSPWLRRVRSDLEAERDAAAPPAGRPAGGRVVPRQLPARPRRFSGRTEELAALDGSGTTVVSALGGIGGVGKTWLALHWAYERLERFPDGQLYANLRGFDPLGDPVHHTAVVRHFLDALGVDPAVVPDDPGARVELYRAMTAGHRVLVVLDNARDSDQVVPLLPGDGCTVVVTSRNRLGALVTRHGARRVALDVLDGAASRALLVEHLGAARVDAEPGAVESITAWCGGLPLALGIVAARASAHPELALAAFAEELRDHAERLDALDTGDDLDLRAVFSWSYEALSPRAAVLFTLLGSVPGPDVPLPAVEALLDGGPARRPLRELEAAHLVGQVSPGRYRMHDLVRLYAAERAGDDRDAALARLTGFYLHSAHHADRLIDPERPAVELDAPVVAPHRPADPERAWEWLAAEHDNIVACLHLAAREGRHAVVWQLAAVLDTFHFRRALFTDHLEAWRHGLAAAERAGDEAVVGRAHRNLGNILVYLGRVPESHDHLLAGLAVAERTGDLQLQNHLHQILTRTWSGLGDDRRSLEHARRTLDLARRIGDRLQEAKAINQVGWVHVLLGEHDEAHEHCTRALRLLEELGSDIGRAEVHDSLGVIERRRGNQAEALGHYRAAVALLAGAGHTRDQAAGLVHLGEVHAELGQDEQARAAWREALTLFRAQERHAEVAEVARLLGEDHRA